MEFSEENICPHQLHSYNDPGDLEKIHVGQGHQNPIISKGPTNDVSVPVWSNLSIGLKNRVLTIWLFHSYMSLVTLKIRSTYQL